MNFKTNILLYLVVSFAPVATFCENNIITIFSHGIADTWKQAHRYVKSYKDNDLAYKNDRYLFETPFVAFDYPDATHKFYRVNYKETSFGQENEIARLNKTYKSTLSRYEDYDIILAGTSRGAANVLIFAGLHQPDHVKALLLESPYFTMADVIERWLPLTYGETIAEFIFKKYTRSGNSPANCIENISKDLPILITCSKEDHLVPCSSSINVYKKLIESGHQHAYIFTTDQGKHAAILDGPDGEKYQSVVHAFYKKYNLPHCPASAAQGEPLLALCQPHYE